MPGARDFWRDWNPSIGIRIFDWESLLEADYVALLSGRDDLNIIDIGGHAGRHSLAIEQKLKPSHLLIFEPLPDQRRSLERMFALRTNVTIYGCALGSRRGRSTFVVKKGASGEFGLRQRTFYNDGNDEDLERIPVMVETLDNLGIPFAVDFIKVDTEGGEIDIQKELRTCCGAARRLSPVRLRTSISRPTASSCRGARWRRWCGGSRSRSSPARWCRSCARSRRDRCRDTRACRSSRRRMPPRRRRRRSIRPSHP